MFYELKEDRKLIKRGNSYCLTLPAKWVRQVGLDINGHSVRVNITGTVITAYPTPPQHIILQPQQHNID